MQGKSIVLGLVLAVVGSCASAPLAPAPLAPPPPSAPIVSEDVAQPASPADMPGFRAKLPTDSGAFYVPTADPLHPRVHYADGQDSLNDSCIVLAGNKLSRRVPPAFVNGRPVGFC
jgi:hypothetical protein